VIEQEHHKKAFEFYYGMGEGRNYNKVAEEFGVSVGAVKLWGRSFGWKRRIGERDAEVARALADENTKDGLERATRNRKIVGLALVQVAKAIAEGKVKPTISDLDRLIRLEEFLREEQKAEGLKVVLWWTDADGKEVEMTDKHDAGSAAADEED
jgi:transposase